MSRAFIVCLFLGSLAVTISAAVIHRRRIDHLEHLADALAERHHLALAELRADATEVGRYAYEVMADQADLDRQLSECRWEVRRLENGWAVRETDDALRMATAEIAILERGDLNVRRRARQIRDELFERVDTVLDHCWVVERDLWACQDNVNENDLAAENRQLSWLMHEVTAIVERELGEKAVSRRLWISVDVEATGPCPGIYSMWQLGAVVCEPALDRTFTANMRPIPSPWIETTWEHPETMAWLKDHAKVDGQPVTAALLRGLPHAEQAMDRFVEWLDDLASDGSKLVFLSDNNGFDWQFVNYYLHWFVGRNPFGHSSRNLGDIYKGMQHDTRPSFKHLRRTDHTHDALDDARGNAEAFLRIVAMGFRP